MKTLLLTSSGMKLNIKIFNSVLPKPSHELKLAHIITAANLDPNREWFDENKKQLIERGFQIEDIDIVGKDENELKSLLKDKDIIYVQGGDPFYLLKHIRLSGFDNVVKVLIETGVIYIGHSAGTWVAQPTIETALWSKPTRATHGITDYTGMHLAPVLTMVHVGKDEKHSSPEYKERVKEGIKKYKYP
ncbi:MAG: Type 1 glutamine amidotransferase-like domain-containing protein, partial [Patescibacteria group bacterium]